MFPVKLLSDMHWTRGILQTFSGGAVCKCPSERLRTFPGRSPSIKSGGADVRTQQEILLMIHGQRVGVLMILDRGKNEKNKEKTNKSSELLEIRAICCREKHVAPAAVLICYVLPLPAAPPLTWTLRRCQCGCERVGGENLLLRCAAVSEVKFGLNLLFDAI